MKRIFTLIPTIFIVISLILSGIQGIVRLSYEQRYKDVEILVSYNDIKKASEYYDESLEEITTKLKEAGVTGVLTKEQTIKAITAGSMTSWEEQGEVAVFKGADLKILETRDDIKLNNYYLWIPNENIRNYIKEYIQYKLGECDEISINNQILLDVGAFSDCLFNIGFGYPIEDLKIISEQGVSISPQIRSWDNVTEESLEYVLNDVKNIPNLGVVYFNDSVVPGYNLSIMQEFARDNTIGIIEFFSEKQEGLYSLIKAASNGGKYFNTIRLHTITDGETKTLSTSQVLDRYLLAVTERNIKSLLVKIPSTSNPEKDYEDWFQLIENLKKELNNSGYNVTFTPQPINLPMSNGLIIWFIGFGPIFFTILYFRWINKEKWGWILAFIGIFIWTGLLRFSPILAKQILSLLTAIIYPTWGVVTYIRQEKRSLKEAFFAFFKISLISLAGALTIIGLLSQTSSVLKIDMFRGVKVAHIVPLVLVPILIQYKKEGFNIKKIKKFLLSPITYLTLVIIGLLGVVFIIYITRTGNSGLASNYEIIIRNALDNILGVRPRTKEFLIGNPLMLMMLYYGYKEKYIPFLLGAIIGQISIVNTYTHIHTPIIISIIRTFHGIWIGLIGGVILIYVFKFIKNLGSRYNLWEE
ncbi:DUF5693 family protein [Defluviitalea phaphyphila]|uniref:DUF5693 family protein n=1 Tax=Defluviitalea phaphyphila TaxID=1473580 RepID=UPI00072FCB88|nr:DUF5693 family protein [Defluviitalea phaphyphila]